MRIQSKSRKVFNVCNFIILSLLAVIFILPYLMILSASFTDEWKFPEKGYSLIPYGFTFENYTALFKNDTMIFRSLLNSLFFTVTGTLAHVTTNCLAAYPLSKKNFMGKNAIMKIRCLQCSFRAARFLPIFLFVVWD